MSTENKIDRKEAIKRTGLLLGGVIFAPNILGVLNGCTATPGEWNSEIFTEAQARLISSLSDVILPADDETPSASEVGVPQFIEAMVGEVYTEEQRTEFLEGLDEFAEEYHTQLQSEFYEDPEDRRYEFTYHQNEIGVEADPDSNERRPFILTFKELTLLGYFTSEEGATQVLRYEPVPGRYDGCMPVEEVGRAWAR